ncbi:MAG: PAS domain S-box protein [Chloroflexi bacterium]|nr:PAS domain S-box protein [Chloroflexota bacterium]
MGVFDRRRNFKASNLSKRLIPKPQAPLEWVWLAARLPIAALIVVTSPTVLGAGSPQALIWWDAAFIAAYSAGIFILLRRGKLGLAFWAGLSLDSAILVNTWREVLRIPSIGDSPTDLYLILFPFLVTMVFRMGAIPGALYSGAVITLMALGDWYYQGPGSYAYQQLPVRVLFLVATVVLAGFLAAKMRNQRADIAEKEARFQRLFDLAPVGIAISDADYRMVEVNDRLSAMLGYPNDALVGRRISDFERGKVARGSRGNYERLVAGEFDSFQIKRELINRSGRSVWTETVTSTVSDDVGQFLYAVRVVTDTTDHVLLD